MLNTPLLKNKDTLTHSTQVHCHIHADEHDTERMPLSRDRTRQDIECRVAWTHDVPSAHARMQAHGCTQAPLEADTILSSQGGKSH